jgi:hypothetical protein
MSRRIAFAAASLVVCAVALTVPAHATDAFWRPRHVDQRVAAVSLGAGIASSLAYWTALDWSWNKHSSGYKWGVWGATTAGCMALSPIIAGAVVRERQLTPREVAIMEGSCVLPIIGGLVVDAIWNPKWDALYGPQPQPKVIRVRHKARPRR